MTSSFLDTAILLWTLYCTKHRNWFHASLMMIEMFTKLPLKNLEVLVTFRQAVRKSTKKVDISCSGYKVTKTSNFLMEV